MASTRTSANKGRRLRAETISLTETHRRSGVSLAHVSKIYGGTRWPSLNAAARIAAARGESIDDVYRDLCAVRGIEPFAGVGMRGISGAEL